MTMRSSSKPDPPKVSIFNEENRADTTTREPEQPTMSNQSVLEPVERPAIGAPPEELAEDIVARPLSMPEFATNIQPYLVNQALAPRWIFTDRRRYSQARAQGFRNCTKHDLKPNFAMLSPFEEDGGTKFVNGDLILMLIDRKRYLGALRHKHLVAAALSDSAVQRTMSARRAVKEMGDEVAAVNRQRMRQGNQPAMTVFTPGAADLNQTVLSERGGAKEMERMGRGGIDQGTISDLKK